MTTKNKRDKYISVVGASYLEMIVIPNMQSLLDVYLKRGPEKNFQVSPHESTCASSDILLTIIALESLTNKLFYHETKCAPKNIKSIADVFKDDPKFPLQTLKTILAEISLIRNVIAHNFLFEMNVTRDENWKYISHSQKLVPGYDRYQDIPKLVYKSTLKTKTLGINIQPLKMGFTDLFTVLATFDLVISLLQNKFHFGKVPFQFHDEIEKDVWVSNLSELLAYYFEKIQDEGFKKSFNKLIKQLDIFIPYIAKVTIVMGKVHYSFTDHVVMGNKCPTCRSFGFVKPELDYSCSSCGLRLEEVKAN